MKPKVTLLVLTTPVGPLSTLIVVLFERAAVTLSAALALALPPSPLHVRL